jgi:hypothetical protein
MTTRSLTTKVKRLKEKAAAKRDEDTGPGVGRVVVYRPHPGDERPWDNWPHPEARIFIPDDGRNPGAPVWVFTPDVGWQLEGGAVASDRPGR